MSVVASLLLLASTLVVFSDEPTPSDVPATQDATAPAVDSDADSIPVPVLTSPRDYLYASYPALSRRLDCMIKRESEWLPYASNGRHQGLAQFDYPTWLETPQGQAGWSRYDPYASIDAMAWGVVHLGYQRWTTARYC